MRILVAAVHPLQDNRIVKMINTINTSDNEIVYVSINENQLLSDGSLEGINVISIPISFTKDNLTGCLSAYRELVSIYKVFRPDIVHVHDPYLIPFLGFAKKNGSYTVYDKHEAFEKMPYFGAKIGSVLERLFRNSIDGVVYVADMQLSYLRSLGYKHIVKIPNYQSVDMFTPVERHDNSVQIVYFGDLSDVSRNTSLMLTLMEELLKRRSDVVCHVGGSTDDIAISERLVNLDRGYTNFIYHGYTPYRDVVRITCEADIGMYLTKFDRNNIGSSPNKIYEYLLAGTAVFSQGRYCDWDSIDGTLGYAFDYDESSDVMLNCLFDLTDDRELLSAMKSAARQYGLSYTWEDVSKQYQRLYENIMCCDK